MSEPEAEAEAAAGPSEPIPPPPSVEAQPTPAQATATSANGDDEIELHPLEAGNKSPEMVSSSEDDGVATASSAQARSSGRRASPVDQVTQELSEAYSKEANPSAEAITALAQRTGLSEQQVATFFANKRARDRAAEAKAETAGAPVSLAPSSQVDEALAQITNEDGGLVDPENAQQLVKLMQMQLNMDDQFLILAVILATKSFQCRKRLLELGGLPPICEWLAAAKRDNKVPLQRELLRVLECLPIKVELLRATSAGKVVKGLKTSADPDVKLRADRLVAAWMSLVAAVDTAQPAAGAPGAVVNAPSSGETAPAPPAAPMDVDAAKKRPAPAPAPAPAASKPSAAAVAKRPRTDDHATPAHAPAPAPAKKPAAPAPAPAPAPKPKPEPPKPKVVAATTLAANDDFDVLTKKKSIVPEHLKKPARTALLIEGEEKKKDEARPAKDASFASKPISADEIRKEKLRQKALGVDKAEPRLESKPGQGAAVAAQLGKIVAAVASGSLGSSDPMSAAAAPDPLSASSPAPPASAPSSAAAPAAAAAAPRAPSPVRPEEPPAPPLSKSGKPKKRLTWADHHGGQLKKVKTFKKDRQDVPEGPHSQNKDAFLKAAHMEHAREKENLLKEKKMHTLDLKVTIAWRRPRPLQLADPQPVVETGEAKAQKERERGILLDMQPFRADRTIDMGKVPETPAEPDPEPLNDDSKALLIPSDDQPAPDAAAAVAAAAAAAAAAATPGAAALAPNLLNLANLHSVLSHMPAAAPQPAVAPPAMPGMDASLIVHALASLVSGAGQPAAPPPGPPMPYYGANPGFSAPPPVQGQPPPYGRDRERGNEPPELLARRHNILCQYFLKGDCKFGARCHFSHNPSEEDIKNAKRKRGGR